LRPKGSPVLVPDGAIDFVRLGKLFAQANAQMPAEISTFVTMRLQLAGAPPPKA
jgi:hypothetical protein